MLGKLRKTWCFPMICGSGGSKTVGLLKRRLRSHLARWEMKNCTPLWWEARSLLPEGTWRPRSKNHVIKTHSWRIDLSILSVSIPENKKLKNPKRKSSQPKRKNTEIMPSMTDRTVLREAGGGPGPQTSGVVVWHTFEVYRGNLDNCFTSISTPSGI